MFIEIILVLIVVSIIALTWVWTILAAVEIYTIIDKSYKLGKTFWLQEWVLFSIIFIVSLIPFLNYYVFKELAYISDTLQDALDNADYLDTQSFFDPTQHENMH